uniref:Uncharacterized protein n=1 Tax=Paramoeba aestuarina TaxID=180227 RepID=A0A7S4KWI6_9EUKA|mmetsp:Transcript_26454/g.41177  ORF Transcript_26454/g.41177 Transcript_26454/m.41177 type:complete len:214 (+) Transcript_26454:50-691(+)
MGNRHGKRKLPPCPTIDLNESGQQMKVVVVGDGAVGKTCLVVTTLSNKFPGEYIPTVCDTGSLEYRMKNGKDVTIEFWDTAGQEDYDRLRPLSYPGVHCFLLLFSILSMASFDNVKSLWLPELGHHCPNVPIILVGTKSDLRYDEVWIERLRELRTAPSTKEQGEQLAKEIGAECYLDTSALKGEGLEELLDQICFVVGGVSPIAGLSVKRAR